MVNQCPHHKEHREYIGQFISLGSPTPLFKCLKCNSLGRMSFAPNHPFVFWDKQATFVNASFDEKIILFGKY